MPDPAREVRGIRRSTPPPEEVCAVIYEVEHSVHITAHSCLIYGPDIFDTDKRIVGVDDGQSVELSEKFVRQMFDYDDIDVVDVKALRRSCCCSRDFKAPCERHGGDVRDCSTRRHIFNHSRHQPAFHPKYVVHIPVL